MMRTGTVASVDNRNWEIMAGEFYRQRVGQHLEIGLKALEKLKAQEWERLHSRKLRSFAEVAFQ